MTQLTFPLNVTLESPRPIFKAYINEIPIKCMLDTGADMPVFCKGNALFAELAGKMGGANEFKRSSIGGFGKNDEYVMLWNMDDFTLSDQKESIVYRGMKIAVLDKPKIPCDMILSASMFMKMKCVIDCSSKKHSLIIMAGRDVYGIGYYDRKETIYIFSIG